MPEFEYTVYVRGRADENGDLYAVAQFIEEQDAVDYVNSANQRPDQTRFLEYNHISGIASWEWGKQETI
jgi:hypothetical protein